MHKQDKLTKLGGTTVTTDLALLLRDCVGILSYPVLRRLVPLDW